MVRQGHSAELIRSPHHPVRLFAHYSFDGEFRTVEPPEQRRRTVLMIFTAAVLAVLAGCEPRSGAEKLLSKEKKLLAAGKELLTVDFQQGRTLRYKFVSSRDIELDWNPNKKPSKPSKSSTDKSSESMDLVVSYSPIEVNPIGLTTIKATCESIKIKRTKSQPRDAAATIQGKSFTFTVGPTGKIEDYSQLIELMKEAGKNAFSSNTDRGRIKDLDMIGDFAASQWFLWDSISSIEKAAEGVSVGQTWKSRLPVPGPMVMRKARDVTYKLAEIRQSEKGKLAVIRSSYSPAETLSDNWPPMPYSGRFQMRGTFGFLRGYKVLGLQGQGEELFNIDTGQIEQYNQRYEVQLEAIVPMGIDVKPRITMKQSFSMQLLK